MNSKNLFKKAAAKSEKTKKDATPEITDDKLLPSINLFLDAKKKEKEAEAQLRLAEATLLPRAGIERILASRVAGEVFSSVKLCANDLKVTVSFPNRYSNIPTAEEESIKEIYGEDKFKTYFKERTVASLTPLALEDENFIQIIVAAIGEDKFASYFKIDQHLEVDKKYHEALISDKDLEACHKRALEAGLVKSTKPSVKPG